jgi:YD repeat-containing protein
VTGKAYSAQSCPLASPVVTYTYDSGANAKGKLTGVTDQAGSASYSYDVLGRLSSETRVIAGVSKSISYEYNLDGSLKTLHYPSGRTVTYTPDSAGRIVSAKDGNGTQYVSSATYYANGAEYQRNMPGIYFRNDLNPRLQVSGFYSNNGQVGQSFLDKSYNYGALHQNNGDVISIVNNKDSSRTQTFAYDALNRITSGFSAASTGALSWGENYGIDPWGNLLISPMAGKVHGGNFQHAGNANNQATGLGYDAAGNLTNYTAPGQYVYDPENRIQSTAGVAYTYDADGNRVEKFSLGGAKVSAGTGVSTETKSYPLGDHPTEVTSKAESKLEVKVGPVSAEMTSKAPGFNPETGTIDNGSSGAKVGTGGENVSTISINTDHEISLIGVTAEAGPVGGGAEVVVNTDQLKEAAKNFLPAIGDGIKVLTGFGSSSTPNNPFPGFTLPTPDPGGQQ